MHSPLRSLLLAAIVLIGLSTATRAETPHSATLLEMPYHPKNGPLECYSPVVHFRGMTYVVMPDDKLIPRVAQIPDQLTETSKVVTVPLDPQSDYKALADPHNGFSIGIDSDGYLHVTGDMHNYGGSDGQTFPERYEGKIILYWKSKKPWDISAGFEFAGGDRATAIPGTAWSYGRFVNNKEGDLYYSSRVRAFWSSKYGVPGDRQGAMGLGLYRYDTATKKWSVIGGLPDAVAPEGSKYFPVFYWAHSGRPDTGFSYQVYQAQFNFDQTGRLHAAISSFIDTKGNARVVYAASDDGGKTWKKADGTSIPGLPLRGETGTENEADVVMDSRHTFITRVAADKNGVPLVLHGIGADDWRVWDGNAWTRPGRTYLWGTQAGLAPDGMLTLWSDYSLARSAGVTKPQTTYRRGIVCASQLGLLTTGKLYGLRADKAAKKVRVVKIEFQP